MLLDLLNHRTHLNNFNLNALPLASCTRFSIASPFALTSFAASRSLQRHFLDTSIVCFFQSNVKLLLRWLHFLNLFLPRSASTTTTKEHIQYICMNWALYLKDPLHFLLVQGPFRRTYHTTLSYQGRSKSHMPV
jgi:hypothetical protein